MKPDITKESVKSLLDTKFIKVYDLQYAEGKHYYDATRRRAEELIATKTDEDFKKMLPDAVTCAVILVGDGKKGIAGELGKDGMSVKDGESVCDMVGNCKMAYECDGNEGTFEPRLLLSREFRYPAGRFLLSPPAGLIDPEDKEGYLCALADESNKISETELRRLADETLISTAKREIKEETGLTVGLDDDIFVINQLLFSTPGMTDESNALVCAVIDVGDALKAEAVKENLSYGEASKADCVKLIENILTTEGAVGSEVFDGFVLVTEAEAKEIIKKGRDSYDNFFSVYTWCVLMYFVSGMWKRD